MGKNMSVTTSISRRRLLQGTAGAAGVAAVGLPGHRANAAKKLVVGFIYVGPKDDYGYNQAHAEAAALLKKLPGVKIIEEEKVPETDAVSKTLRHSHILLVNHHL
jgi:basic membrane protein A